MRTYEIYIDFNLKGYQSKSTCKFSMKHFFNQKNDFVNTGINSQHMRHESLLF